jgi:DNA topoisomerase IB
MRIGNKKSEENDVRGLHNLQLKHMTIHDNEITLAYVGKKMQSQKHTFEVSDALKKNISELTEGKGPEDPIFTWNKDGKQIRIAPRRVNDYLKDQLGSNVTVHHFRHHHGSQRAEKYLNDVSHDPSGNLMKMSIGQVKQAVREALVVTSDYLGNTPNVAKKHYIDPTIFEEFFKKMGVNPKEMRNAMKALGLNKTAKSEFDQNQFSVRDDISGTTPDEDSFYERMGEVVLEDLEPIEEDEIAE